MSNKIRLEVGGMEYYLTTDEDEAYMRNISHEVDYRLNTLMTENPVLSTTMAAVLAALEYCDESKKAGMEADELRAKLKQYVEDSACIRIEADEARREIERLNRENQVLRKRISGK